jgi:hypothetical protein
MEGVNVVVVEDHASPPGDHLRSAGCAMRLR